MFPGTTPPLLQVPQSCKTVIPPWSLPGAMDFLFNSGSHILSACWCLFLIIPRDGAFILHHSVTRSYCPICA